MRQLGFLALLSITFVGCDDSRPVGDAGGGGGIDAGAGGVDSGGPGADSGSPGGDAGSSGDAGVPGYRRFPDVPLVNVGHASWDVVSFVTFNITVTPTGDLTEAYFVVRNDDPLLSLCSVSGEVAMIDASGGSLGSFFVSYDSQVMEAFGIALTCIAPGGIALGYGNASGSALLDRVAELHYVFNGDGYDTTVPYADVRNEGLAVIDPYGGGMYWALSGTLRVVTGSIRSPDVTVFPIVGGLPIDDLGHIELATFGAGDRLPYTTTAAETMFSEYFVTVDYRAPSPVVADTPELRRAILDRDRRDAIREANRARVRTHF